MTADPFEHFGEQQQSFELIEGHREILLEDAQEFIRENPQVPVVGLIFDGAALEATDLRAAFEKATGQPFEGRGFIGVAPREFVVRLVRANAPAAIEWLPDSMHGTTRMLPVAAYTKNGVRFAAIEFE